MFVQVDRTGSSAIVQVVEDNSLLGRSILIWAWREEGPVTTIEDHLAMALVEATRHRRLATSPTGPVVLICQEGNCRHSWADHDDDGCLWHHCGCTAPKGKSPWPSSSKPTK